MKPEARTHFLLAAAIAGLMLAGCTANGGPQPPAGGGNGGNGAAARINSFTADPTTVTPGQTSTLSWSTTDATSCTASGPSGTSDWSGSKPASGSQAVTPPSTPGVYTYTLTCTGPGGTSAPSSVNVTVGNAGASACTAPIVVGGSTVSTAASATCLACSVSSPGNLIDADTTNFAQILLTLSALTGSESITVTAQPGIVFPAGNIAGFTLSIPPAALAAAQVLPGITINTLMGGTQQETTTFSQTLTLDVLGLLSNNAQFFVGLKTAKDFDAVQIVSAPTIAGALTTLDVYDACSNASGIGGIPASTGGI